MQGRLHTTFVAEILCVLLLCWSSQALPILNRPTGFSNPSFSYSLQRSNNGQSRNEHEQIVGGSQSAHGSLQIPKRADDADTIVPLYNLALRRDDLSTDASTDGLQQSPIISIQQSSIKPNLHSPSADTPTLPESASNSTSAFATTATDGPSTLPAHFAHLTNANPSPDNLPKPIFRAPVYPTQTPENEQLQANQGSYTRRRRVAPLPFTVALRESAQAPLADSPNAFGCFSAVHNLYTHKPTGNSHKPHEYNGNAWKSKSEEKSRGQSFRFQPFSFLGRFSPQSVFASDQRPLDHLSHTHMSPFEPGQRMDIFSALRLLGSHLHDRLLPFFLGRRPFSPYITNPPKPVPFRRPLPYHRPAGPHHIRPLNSNAGTIHMFSPSLTPSHPLPLAFTLSPETCSPLALECECITHDLASRLLAAYPSGIPSSTNSISETVSMFMHGVEYRATLDLKTSAALNAQDFKDLLGLLVSVKKELVEATHGHGFGTASIRGHWHNASVEARWTYYKIEHGIARKCA
jgi:hypothetical protein